LPLFAALARTDASHRPLEASAEAETSPPSPARRVPRQTVLLQVSLAAAALALFAGLASRGAVSRRWPFGTPFEFALACSGCGLLTYLLLLRTTHAAAVGPLAVAPFLALLLHAFLIQPQSARAIQPTNPVMTGSLFVLHTALSALAFGALGVAGGSAAGCLIRPAARAGALVDRAMDLAYVTLSLAIIAGAMWGERAWGEYWSWSAKEVWTLITWLICTLYQHVRCRRGWPGARAMAMVVLALAAAAITLLGTPALVRWTRLQSLRIY
jgi:ABC-type transport system involved in cytochrome c biogenesis permease subunit